MTTKPTTSDILIVFIGNAKAEAYTTDYANPPNDEAAQAWITDMLKKFPTAEAGDFIMVRGARVDVEIIPPDTAHKVILGAPAPKPEPYKACSRGVDCKAATVVGSDVKPGNAYRRKTGGLCRACFEGEKKPPATTEQKPEDKPAASRKAGKGK